MNFLDVFVKVTPNIPWSVGLVLIYLGINEINVFSTTDKRKRREHLYAREIRPQLQRKGANISILNDALNLDFINVRYISDSLKSGEKSVNTTREISY